MRFIIATNSATTTASGRNALTAFLEAKGWSVWHWYEDLWLIDSAPLMTDFEPLSVEIKKAVPAIIQLLFLSTEGVILHYGLVPAGSAEWFEEHWGRRGRS